MTQKGRGSNNVRSRRKRLHVRTTTIAYTGTFTACGIKEAEINRNRRRIRSPEEETDVHAGADNNGRHDNVTMATNVEKKGLINREMSFMQWMQLFVLVPVRYSIEVE